MKCFVTGASGFIGSNLVHELVARGHRVKALLRPESDARGLCGAEFERVTGDILDRQLLEREMDGCDWCFHVAASYRFGCAITRRCMRRMSKARATSSKRRARPAAGKLFIPARSAASACRKKWTENLRPTDETEHVSDEQMTNDYKRSKFRAEGVAFELFRKKGLPIVIVNPTAPVGPRDVKPTPTGQLIVDFLNRKLPAYLDTGLNWVHVRDVAVGHILAAEKGRFGERYILGNAEGNWTMQEMLKTLEEITGIPAPKIESAVLGRVSRGGSQRDDFILHRQTAARAAGRRAHGEI